MATTFIDRLICTTLNGQPVGASSSNTPDDLYAPFYNLRVTKGITNQLNLSANATNAIILGGSGPLELANPELILTPQDGAGDIIISEINASGNERRLNHSEYSFTYNLVSKNMTINYERVTGMTYKAIYEAVTGPITTGGLLQFNGVEAERSLNNIIIEPTSALIQPSFNCVSNSIVIGLDNNLSAPENAQIQSLPSIEDVNYVPRVIVCVFNAEFEYFELVRAQNEPMYGPYMLSHCLGLADTRPYDYDGPINVLLSSDSSIYGTIALADLGKLVTRQDSLDPAIITRVPSAPALVDGLQINFTLIMNNGIYTNADGASYVNNVAIGQANALVGSGSTVLGNNNKCSDNSINIGNGHDSLTQTGVISIGSAVNSSFNNTIGIGSHNEVLANGLCLGNNNNLFTNIRNPPTIKQNEINNTLFDKLKTDFKSMTGDITAVDYSDQIYLYEEKLITSSNRTILVGNPENGQHQAYGYYFAYPGNTLEYGPATRFIVWPILSRLIEGLEYGGLPILPNNFNGEPVITTPGNYVIESIDAANGLIYVAPATSPQNGAPVNMPATLNMAYYRLKYENDIFETDCQIIGNNNFSYQPNSTIVGSNNRLGDYFTSMNATNDPTSNCTIIGDNNQTTNAAQAIIIGANNTFVGDGDPNVSNLAISAYGCTLINCVNSTLINCSNCTMENGANSAIIGFQYTDLTALPSLPNSLIVPGFLNMGKTVKNVVTPTPGPAFSMADIKDATDIYINTMQSSLPPPYVTTITIADLDGTIGRVYNITPLVRYLDSITLNVPANITVYIYRMDEKTGKAYALSESYVAHTDEDITGIREAFTLTCIGANIWVLSGEYKDIIITQGPP